MEGLDFNAFSIKASKDVILWNPANYRSLYKALERSQQAGTEFNDTITKQRSLMTSLDMGKHDTNSRNLK